MRSSLVVFALVALGGACTDDKKAADAGAAPIDAAAAAKPALAIPSLPAAVGDPPADAVASISGLLPGSSGWCVQIRSVPTRLEADRLAASIREELGLEVALIEKDLKERGLWWRVCVGHEPTEAAAERAARKWTAPGGELRKHMSDVVPGQALYQVLEKPGQAARVPSKEMAATLMRARPDEERRPVIVSASGRLYGAVTLPPDSVGATDVAVIAEDGSVLGYDLAARPEGCEACRAALADVRPARRLLSGGDVAGASGEELLIEERGGDDDAVLSVFAVDGSRIKRVAWFLLGTSTANLRVLGDARAIDANGEAGAELALTRIELPLVGDRLCALRKRVEVLDLRRSPARKLDVAWANTMGVAEQTGGAAPARHLVAALDQLGDDDAASRICASYLKAGKDATLATLCIARVTELMNRGRVVAAVNAAGLLAEASESLRAAVAGPFFKAASALDADPQLSIGSKDCEAAPLIDGVSGKRLEHLVKLATLRLADRVELADLVPEVFVTGTRDFGPEAPVGRLTAGWLARLKERLPARHAVIEAQVRATTGAAAGLPAAPSATPASDDGKQAEPRRRESLVPSRETAEPSSGYIHIEVHEGTGEDDIALPDDDDEALP